MRRAVLFWTLLIAGLAFVTVLVVTALVVRDGDVNEVNSFETCKEAGGRIAESYPEQCFIDGRSFMNETQSIEQANPGDEYIGLAEQAALNKATSQNKPHRVVSRDGEALPVTMDFVSGRLNFYIEDGLVKRVMIEGES